MAIVTAVQADDSRAESERMETVANSRKSVHVPDVLTTAGYDLQAMQDILYISICVTAIIVSSPIIKEKVDARSLPSP